MHSAMSFGTLHAAIYPSPNTVAGSGYPLQMVIAEGLRVTTPPMAIKDGVLGLGRDKEISAGNITPTDARTRATTSTTATDKGNMIPTCTIVTVIL